MVAAFIIIIIRSLKPVTVEIKNERLEVGRDKRHHEGMNFKDLENIQNYPLEWNHGQKRLEVPTNFSASSVQRRHFQI